jgi:anaerobic selenocysteine-containing dehydrogenase
MNSLGSIDILAPPRLAPTLHRMARPWVDAGGGIPALLYVLRKSREAGGFLRLYRRLRSRNACKTCALGMGGTRGGMVNEAGRFPEVCKKSIQAQAGDMGAVFDESRFSKIAFPVLERMTAHDLERLGRITVPMLARRGARTFERISWDDALARTAARFRETTPNRTFIYASGRSSNEAAFLLQLVARAFGTPHINNCSYYCHSASGVALRSMDPALLRSYSTIVPGRPGIVMSANPASNHPRLITRSCT